VLTEAAIEGKSDQLIGLKENVIIGKLIPARAQVEVEQPMRVTEMILPPGFSDDSELRDEFEDIDEDWNDDDFEDEPLDIATEEDDFPDNGAASEVALLEETPPATAEEVMEPDSGGNGARPLPDPSEEEPL
ncbi:MAG TPA: hypothetical protein VGR43_06140, partial [Dehalococcoidia bacterium]|nr:hypothetical protein [Dehalococcoidia bacterium]